MRPTIKSLSDKVAELSEKLNDMQYNNEMLSSRLRYADADLDSAHKATEAQRQVVRERDVTIAALRRDLMQREEVLALTKELLQARTQQLEAATGTKIKSSNGTPMDMLSFWGHTFTRQEIDATVKQMHPDTNSPFIHTIKVIRDRTGAGLRETKDFCDKYFAHLKHGV